MVLVLVLDGVGYLLAVNTFADGHHALVSVLAGYLRRRGAADDQRRAGAARHDHLLGEGGQRGRQAPDLRHARRLLAARCARSAAATSTRRMRRSTSCRSSRIRATSSARWPTASTSCRSEVKEAALGPRRGAREHAHGARRAARARTQRSPISPITIPLTDLPNRTAARRAARRGASTAPKAGSDSFAVLSRRPRPFQGSQRRVRPRGRRRAAVRDRAAPGGRGRGRFRRPRRRRRVHPDFWRRRAARGGAKRWPTGCCRRWPTRSRSSGQQIPIGLSIGAAVYPQRRDRHGALLANADAALYRAKADGRGTVRFFDPEMDRRLRERYALQHDLRSAIGSQASCPALSAAGQDRRRGLRLRGAGALAAPDARAGAADRHSSRSPSRTA